MRGEPLRRRLVELARRIQDSRDRGGNDVASLRKFNLLSPGTDIDNLCNSDWDVEMIVDVCMGKKTADRRMTHEQLVALVRRFFNYRIQSV